MAINFRKILASLTRDGVLPASGMHAPTKKHVGANIPSAVTPSLVNDVYISPEIEPQPSPLLRKPFSGPVGWVKQLLLKQQMLETVKTIAAKINLLPSSSNDAIRYFFDNDLPTLVFISRKYPAWVHQMLNQSLENSPTRNKSEPWYRLVQLACGDARAILPALDGLC